MNSYVSRIPCLFLNIVNEIDTVRTSAKDHISWKICFPNYPEAHPRTNMDISRLKEGYKNIEGEESKFCKNCVFCPQTRLHSKSAKNLSYIISTWIIFPPYNTYIIPIPYIIPISVVEISINGFQFCHNSFLLKQEVIKVFYVERRVRFLRKKLEEI